MTDLPPAISLSHYHSEPVWMTWHRLRRAQVPAKLRAWLLDSTSLTQRVIGACQGPFRVHVLSQEWTRPMRNECLRLGIPLHERALVRQVQLRCGDIPWVYARTVIPRASLRGRGRRLAWLGSRSLGATLFADPTMHRSPLELVCVGPRNTLYSHLGKMGGYSSVLWGRRSVFTLSNRPLLVSEIFLPTLLERRS